MSLLTSAPDGFTTLGWRRYLIANLATWIAPAVIGSLALGAQSTLGTQTRGDGGLMLWAISSGMILSTALSWFGLILADPLTAALMDRGWFCWVPATGLGLGLRAGIGWIPGSLAQTIPACGLLTLTLRGLLGRIASEAL